jgi:hypothetical protein
MLIVIVNTEDIRPSEKNQGDLYGGKEIRNRKD